MPKMSLRDVKCQGKRVLMRVDFNVPLADGKVENDKRIVASLPSIKHVIEAGGKLILMSHLGRPKGKANPEFSLKPAADKLAEHLGKPVKMAGDCIGPKVEAEVKAMKNGDVLMLENVRFYKEEEANDPSFAKQLAAFGDIYVNDAFGSAHRAHASTEGVTKYISPSVSGFLMEKELEYLIDALAKPPRPFVAILGGAKVSDKIMVIENLLDEVDTLLIGGGMTYTFMAAKGRKVGDSLLEADKVEVAKQALVKAEQKKVKMLLPVDHVLADAFDANAKTKIISADEDIPAGWRGLDIGPKTIQIYEEVIKGAKTIVWNGPMGVFEMEPFSKGTIAVAKALAASGATTIIGGGDSVSAVKKAGVSGKISHISTGGGASLEVLEGKDLPGVVALTDK